MNPIAKALHRAHLFTDLKQMAHVSAHQATLYQAQADVATAARSAAINYYAAADVLSPDQHAGGGAAHRQHITDRWQKHSDSLELAARASGELCRAMDRAAQVVFDADEGELHLCDFASVCGTGLTRLAAALEELAAAYRGAAGTSTRGDDE